MAAEPSELPELPPDPGRRRRARGWRAWVRRTGLTLILTGLALLGFVAYQLWGTGVLTARAQNRLRGEFEQQLEQAPPPVTTRAPTPGAAPPPFVEEPDAVLVPEQGDALARLRIPKIGLDAIVVEGVDTGDLRNG